MILVFFIQKNHTFILGDIMRLSDLQNKDVVNISDGVKIGNIIDIEIDEKGSINKIYIYSKKGIFNFNKEEDYIYWDQISKIGADVILISKKQ